MEVKNLKKRISILFTLLVLLFIVSVPQTSAQAQEVYIVPIEGEVGPTMEAFVRESIEKAEENNAKAIIFNIDTPGGQVDSAINISEVILNAPIKTIAYVNKEAISAGTIIAISSEEIYMSPYATIGAAETRPSEEKYISYWTGKLRNVAEIRGRDSELIAAMADADVKIEGVIEKGKILTLTAAEAMKLKFIEGVEDSIAGVQSTTGLSDYGLQELNPSFQMRLASLATGVVGSSILLTIGFIGIIIELFTPGFGVGGTIGIIALGLYFGGGLLVGASSFTVAILVIVSIILLLIELFVPGFGIPGILGIIGIIASIIIASSSVEQAIISLIIAFALTIVAIILLIKFAPGNKIFEKISLDTSMDRESGYRSTIDYQEYEGKIGKTLTPLRPSGTIEIENKRLDAISENVYIEKDQEIKIVKVEGSRIIVRKTN